MNNSLLPPNSSDLERDLERLIDTVFSEIEVSIEHIWDTKRCPKKFLPWLAWSLSVDEWDMVWPEEQKRRAIANSAEAHRHKGTLYGMRKALEPLGIDIKIIEWCQDDELCHGETRKPYTFKITLKINDRWEELKGDEGAFFHPGFFKQLKRVVGNNKPVRAHECYELGVDFDAVPLRFGSVLSAHTIAHKSTTLIQERLGCESSIVLGAAMRANMVKHCSVVPSVETLRFEDAAKAAATLRVYSLAHIRMEAL